MKIGIDARLYSDTGIGRYITNMIRELEKIDHENDYVIFMTKKGSDLYKPKNEKFKKWIADYPVYSVQEQTSFLIDLMRAQLDLLHVPHFNVPILYPRKFVVTIHDLTMHEFTGGDSTTKDDLTATAKYWAYKIVVNSAIRRSKNITVPSESVKNDLVEKFKLKDKEKISIAYEGVDEELLILAAKDKGVLRTRLEEMHITDNYFLYVGTAYPHKNLNSLIVSYKSLLDQTGHKNQLVLAGKIDTFSQRLAAFSHALKLDRKVIYAAKYSEERFVPEKDLAYLYKGAFGYICPSLKEGFSITPLEAQAFGVPVLISDIPTHREIFGDSALYFDPNSNIDITDKMKEFVEDADLRAELTEKGFENVKKYSWSEMAKNIINLYKNA